MKRFALTLTLFALFGCSSNSNLNQTARFHDDGRAKPIVAFVPVFDRSGSQLGWSLADEFTDNLRSRFLKKDNFYISSPDMINAAVADLSGENNPFTTDTAWIKEAFEDHEYVIFTELVEHDIHPKELKGNFLDKITPSSELTMTMRIRVFDLRGKTPEIILQEFVHQSYVIPKPGNIDETSPEHWKKITFAISPLGLAHAQLTKEVVKRVEDYILLSKTQ